MSLKIKLNRSTETVNRTSPYYTKSYIPLLGLKVDSVVCCNYTSWDRWNHLESCSISFSEKRIHSIPTTFIIAKSAICGLLGNYRKRSDKTNVRRSRSFCPTVKGNPLPNIVAFKISGCVFVTHCEFFPEKRVKSCMRRAWLHKNDGKKTWMEDGSHSHTIKSYINTLLCLWNKQTLHRSAESHWINSQVVFRLPFVGGPPSWNWGSGRFEACAVRPYTGKTSATKELPLAFKTVLFVLILQKCRGVLIHQVQVFNQLYQASFRNFGNPAVCASLLIGEFLLVLSLATIDPRDRVEGRGRGY